MPRNQKHLIVIHGRASKPSETEKLRLVRLSLQHGLGRVNKAAAAALRDGKIKFSFIYYGDINNRMMLEKDPDRAKSFTGKNDEKHRGAPCEPDGSYDKDLKTLFGQRQFDRKAYRKFLKKTRDRRGFDEIAGAISWVASLIGLSETVIRKATPDMGAYLTTRKIGSAVRYRLQGPLEEALLAGENVCLVSHSMGCIVSYDVLWKLSQMSEYRDVQRTGSRVRLWLTLGNPLGEPGVKQNLYDADERSDGKYPKKIIKNWVNISARDDFVAHDEKIADDFKEMKQLKYVERIKDIVNIHTFWAGTAGANAHKFYGYLDHPEVARPIAGWITG